MRREPAPCRDCGVDTVCEPCEWYMVTGDVWAQAAMEPNGGYLCIGCLERRLRRRLRPDDFMDAPVNTEHVKRPTPRYAWSYRTRRLRDRLLGRGLPVHDPAQGRLFEVEHD